MAAILVLLLVAVAAAMVWPGIFRRDKGRAPDNGSMLPGNPAVERTPDPRAGDGRGPSYVGYLPQSQASAPADEPGDEPADEPPVAPAPRRPPERRPPEPVAPEDGRAPSAEAATLLADAAEKERRGEILAARSLLSRALAAAPNAVQRAEIVSRLVAVCGRTILGSKVISGDPDAELYEVQSGDFLSTIGRRYDIPYELVKRLNGLPSDMIQVGQKLKVIRGPFRVRVVKSRFTLELWLRDLVVRTFPVAIGANDSTPVGMFAVTDKAVDPTFFPPKSLRGRLPVIEGGRPENPLGSRWIRFGEKELSLGIHGTNEPDSIGKRVSLGCVRMLNSDVEFLYDCLVTGAKVEVVE